jgi:ferritin-like metal-binding protein YciE
MQMQSLDEVYMNKLKDLYDAENQIVEALPKMGRAASSEDLKEAFQKHLEQTKGQIGRLDEVFEMLGASAGNRQCVGMRGLLEEGKELLNGQEQGAALDAALIAAAQSVEHYEIAGYGSAQTWARELGQSEAADLLEETFEKEIETDENLTEIAETLVNRDAGADEDVENNPELIEASDEESLDQAEEASPWPKP